MTAAELVKKLTDANYNEVKVEFSDTGVVVTGKRDYCGTNAQSAEARSQIEVWAPFCRHFAGLNSAAAFFLTYP